MKSKKETCMDEEAPLGAKKPRSLPTTDALLGNTSVVPLMRARSYTYTLSLFNLTSATLHFNPKKWLMQLWSLYLHNYCFTQQYYETKVSRIALVGLSQAPIFNGLNESL